MKEKLEKLQEVIGYQFRDPGLLTHALTHSSYANEKHWDKTRCNERLEFLGDAVLEVISRDRKSTRLNSSHIPLSRMPSSA